MRITKIVLLGLILSLYSTSAFTADSDVIATVSGHNITEKEVMEIASTRMMKILSKMYDIKKSAVNDLVDEYLLEQEAKKKGTTVKKLIAGVRGKIKDVSEAEAKTIYQLQKNRFKGKSFEDIKGDLMNQLKRQKKQMAMNEFLASLRKDVPIKINLERPRADVSVDDDPSQGNKNAPITLVEFSEFQCPFCKKARPTIEKILSEYKGKIRYVFRDFPLGFHKQAKLAANAANCANDQGKYWEYSEELWDSQGKHNQEKITEIAKKLKLNMGTFEKCVSSKKYYSEIDKDQSEGSSYGVTGTPAYFVNGLFLSGAQPFNKFKELIDEELEKKGAK